MQIEVWSDFSCPFCYIGKRRLENALKKLGNPNIEVIYKAYQLDPSAPKSTSLSAVDYFVKRKGITKDQTLKMFSQVTSMAKATGLTYHLENTIPTNTFTAHRLAKWARTYSKESELTTLLMHAYFTEGKDIAHELTLLEAVKSLSLNEEEALSVMRDEERFKEDVLEEINEAQELGVGGVPFFVLNRKYAISGAQDEALFIQALTQVLNEEKDPLTQFGDQKAPSCDDESCDF